MQCNMSFISILQRSATQLPVKLSEKTFSFHVKQGDLSPFLFTKVMLKYRGFKLFNLIENK